MKIKIILLFLIILFSLSYVSASIELIEKNIKDKFYQGEKLSGNIELNILNESYNSYFKVDSAYPNSFITLVRRSNQFCCFCQPFDCSPRYTAFNSTTTKTIEIRDNESSFGLKVIGNRVRIVDIKLNLSGNFGEQDRIPLKIDFFDRVANWVYKELPSPETPNSYNSPNWGCYDITIPNSGIGLPPHEKFQIASDSRYCEKIYLPESSYVRAGAEIESTSPSELKISVYNEDNQVDEITSCTYNSSQGDCYLARDQGNWYREGSYYFCLGLKNPNSPIIGTISIFKENYGNTCGWYIPQGYNLNQMIQTRSLVDYSIYAKTGKYAPSKPVIIGSSNVDRLIERANFYLNQTYHNLCSSGCTLPIFVSGVNQNVTIYGAKIDYEIIAGDGGITTNSLIYDLFKMDATFDFSGTLDLSTTNYTLTTRGNTSLILKFNNQQILSFPISVFSESSIGDIYPSNPPAGLKTNLTINVRSDAGISKIEWNFGDNETTQTTSPSVEHIYRNIGNYNLLVKLTDINGVAVTKTFAITVTSPIDFINSDLDTKTKRLGNLTSSIASLPIWIQGKVKEKINFSFYEREIREIQILKATNAGDQKLVDLFSRLQNLKVPSYVFVSEQSTSPNILQLDKIDPEIILSYAGGEIDNSTIEDYKVSILNWQNRNTISEVNKTQISYFDGSDNLVPVLGIYSISIAQNSSEEIYIVINQNLGNLEFRSNEDPVRIEQSTLIEFMGNKKIEFFDLTGNELTFFISPKLSSLNVISYIQECNFNGICEKGETISGCRNDCKPTKLATWYFITLGIILFCFYSFLAWWYKYRYESRLFINKTQVYNIVMFILNSRSNGLSDWRIRDLLGQKSWNSEQISYGFKKANGQRIGFPEIIPIEKIKLFFMKIKVKANSLNHPAPKIVKW